MTETANAQRVARHRMKKDIERLGRMNGWTLIPDATVFVAPNGTTVVVGLDGARIQLVLDPAFDHVGGEASTLASSQPRAAVMPGGRRIYAPKSWAPARWNANRAAIIERQMTKAEVLADLRAAAEKSDKPNVAKQTKHMQAVLEALPDTPDWYLSIPVADEPEDSNVTE